MSQKNKVLRVAPPIATQHATVDSINATSAATQYATAKLKALANGVSERNTTRNSTATSSATERNKHADKSPNLLRTVAATQEGQSDPLRWPRFVALCTAHGVTEEEVRAMFTKQDIEDLCEEPDSKLAKHTATIVGAIKRATRHKDETKEKARTYTTLVRCGRCQHFERNLQNPSVGLGECTKRVDVAMGVPARRIDCGQYQQRPRT